jgi:hypothetical protein
VIVDLGGEAADEFWGGEILPIADKEGLIGGSGTIGTGEDSIDEVADIDRAATIA